MEKIEIFYIICDSMCFVFGLKISTVAACLFNIHTHLEWNVIDWNLESTITPLIQFKDY